MATLTTNISNVSLTVSGNTQQNVLKIKENGNWANIKKICKKIDGVWVEQSNSNWEELFDSNIGYISGKPNPIAIFYNDLSLIFQDSDTIDASHGGVAAIYTGWDTDYYLSKEEVPWYKDNNHFNISNISINTIVAPNSIQNWFSVCDVLYSVDISNLDISRITSMEEMFYGCNNLPLLDVSSLNTSNVTNMRYIFRDCSGIKTLDVRNFNTSNVMNMQGMFSNCSNLTSLDVGNFNTSNVTDMSSMFSGCTRLTSLDVGNFDTSKVTNMSSMFSGCQWLTSLDLSNFDTSKVTDMSSMFSFCYNLTSLDVSSFDTSNITNMYRMFYYCQSLTSLDLSNFDTSKVTRMDNMFDGCTNPNLTVYVKDEATKTKIESSLNFPSSATVVVGSPN